MPGRLLNLARRLPLLVALAGLAGMLGLFLTGILGGFDFTDEGAYYLGFAYPGDVPDGNTSYRFFGGRIFSLVRHDILAMRVCTLLVALGGAGLFLWGWRVFVGRFAPGLAPDSERRRLTCAVALTAALLGFAISPAALSYNFQNAFCLLAAGGFLFAAAARPKEERALAAATLAPLLAFGLLVGLQFFVKFSSGIALAGSGGLFFLVVSEKSLRQKAVLVVLLVAMVGTVAVVYFSFFQSFARWWTGIGAIARLVTTGDYTSGQLLRYRGEFYLVLAQTLRYFVPVWVVTVVALGPLFVLRQKPDWQAGAAVLGGLGVIGAVLWLMGELADDSDISRVGLLNYLGGLLLLAVLAAASGLARPRPASDDGQSAWRLALAGGFLFVLPYIGSLGTSNNINQNCLYQLTPWFVLAGLLLAMLDRRWGTAWPSRLGLLLFAAAAASQFYYGYWEHPYRVTGSRGEQTVPTAIGDPATSLRLSPATHDFVVAARQSLQEHGFKRGDDLLVFFDLPGFVFAMGGASPRHQWYFSGNQAVLDDSALHLRLLDPERRKHAFIVRNGNSDWDAFLPSIRATGLPFPEGYQQITPALTSPFTGLKFEIWQPRPTTAGP